MLARRGPPVVAFAVVLVIAAPCSAWTLSKELIRPALVAAVAWSAASPPRSTYSIALPFELRMHRYGFSTGGDPLPSGMLDPGRIRPRPARTPLTLFSPRSG
jgi:hypothetical protein